MSYGMVSAHAVVFVDRYIRSCLQESRTMATSPIAAHPMAVQRNQWIDFFRGLALIFIVVDHIALSPLSHFTMRNYALCDASELFVFISGLAATIAFSKVSARSGVQTASTRMYRRSGKLYLAYLATALGLSLAGALLNHYGLEYRALWGGFGSYLVEDPLGYMVALVTLFTQPSLANILTVYVILMSLVPLFVRGLTRAPILLLGVSFIVWWLAPQLNTLLPSDMPTGYFYNPFAWQFIFILGMTFGIRGPEILAALDRNIAKVTWAAGIFAALAAAQAFVWQMPDVRAIFPPKEVTDWLYPISKSDLHVLRLLSFLSLAWLVRLTVNRISADWTKAPLRWFTLIGRNGLPCFTLGTGISLVGDVINLNSHIPGVSYAVDLVAVVLMIFIGWATEEWDRRRKTWSPAAGTSKSGAVAVPAPAPRKIPKEV